MVSGGKFQHLWVRDLMRHIKRDGAILNEAKISILSEHFILEHYEPIIGTESCNR